MRPETVFRAPRHPYTIGLLESLPQLNAERATRLLSIPGQPPDLSALPPGCPFADRCTRVIDICRTVDPKPVAVAAGQLVRCHRALDDGR